MSLTRKQAIAQGIDRKNWKRSHKKTGRTKKRRDHTRKTQTKPEHNI